MDEKQAPDWGVSITSRKKVKGKVKGGEAIEITVEISYEALCRAIEKLKAIPFAANMPNVVKAIDFLKSLMGEDQATWGDASLEVKSEWNTKDVPGPPVEE